MNTKRQTIWLVSMLSLMVVLSAYYLFTEDISNLQFTTTSATTDKTGTTGTGTTGTTGTSAKEIVINTNDLNVNPTSPDTKATDTKTTTKTEAKTGTAVPDTKTPAAVPAAPTNSSTTKTQATPAPPSSSVKPDAKTTQPTAKANDGVSAADAKVLQQVMTQAKSGTDYFTSLGLKRNEDIAKMTEKWMTVLADPKQTAEVAANAEAELRKIQDNEAKVTNLEDLLMKDFPQAVITEESSKWRVTVQSNKLEKSQAVNIVDKVMKEMNVDANKIVVQFVP